MPPKQNVDQPAQPRPSDGCLMASADWDRLWRRPARSPTQGDNRYAHGARSGYLRYVSGLLTEVDCGGKSFIELGCGSALLSRCLFDVLPFGSAVVLDFSPQALELAKANCCDRDIRVVLADVLSWDTGEWFDLAMSVGLIEHFSGPALTRAVARHAELLKEDGYAIVFMPRRGLLWPVLSVVNRLQGIREEPPRDAELLRVMESVGLRVEKVQRFGAGLLLGVLARKCPARTPGSHAT